MLAGRGHATNAVIPSKFYIPLNSRMNVSAPGVFLSGNPALLRTV